MRPLVALSSNIIKKFTVWGDIHNFLSASSDADMMTAATDKIEEQESFLQKPPTPISGNKYVLQRLLSDEFRRPNCKLRWKTERDWIRNKIIETLNAIQAFIEQQAVMRHENGELLNSNKNMSPHYGFKKFCTALFKGIRPEFPCHFGWTARK